MPNHHDRWNSWNHFHCSINETLIRNTAKAIASSPLKAAGYVYVNMDGIYALSLFLIFSFLSFFLYPLFSIHSLHFLWSTSPRVADVYHSSTVDCWAYSRMTNGSIQPSPTDFPSGIAALASYGTKRIAKQKKILTRFCSTLFGTQVRVVFWCRVRKGRSEREK